MFIFLSASFEIIKKNHFEKRKFLNKYDRVHFFVERWYLLLFQAFWLVKINILDVKDETWDKEISDSLAQNQLFVSKNKRIYFELISSKIISVETW